MGIRFLTAGDSHGDALLGIIEGIPAGVAIDVRDIARELARRRAPYGRSSRQKIEQDEVTLHGGLWNGITTGAPIGIVIPNRARTVQGKPGGALGNVPRPGHADFAGVMKYDLGEIPPVSERASARSTAMRVAVGAVAKACLERLGIYTTAHVVSIGDVTTTPSQLSFRELRKRAEASPVYCAHPASSKRMIAAIQKAKAAGDSLGGSVEVIVTGLFPGIGSHVAWDRRLDGRLSGAMMSIHSVKAVEVGEGFNTHRAAGIDAQDAMLLKSGRVVRPSNHAGGIEGGMTNGEDVLHTLEASESPYVRSDTCVIPALAVVAEHVAAWEILSAVLEKLGGDSIDDTIAARDHVRNRMDARLRPRGRRASSRRKTTRKKR